MQVHYLGGIAVAVVNTGIVTLVQPLPYKGEESEKYSKM